MGRGEALIQDHLVLSTELIMSWPPLRVSKPDVSSVSHPLEELWVVRGLHKEKMKLRYWWEQDKVKNTR